jgi:integrase
MPTADADLTPLLPLVRNLNRLPPGKSEHWWRHPDLVGFSLRVRRGANNAILNNWYFQRRKAGRKELGDATKIRESEALRKARQIDARVELGEDVKADRAEQKAANAASLKALLTDYVAYKAKTLKPNSLAALRHYLLGRDEPSRYRNQRSKTGMTKSYLAPYHNRPACKLTRAEVSTALVQCEERSGKPSATQLRSGISAALSWGIRRGIYHLESNVATDAHEIEDEVKLTGRVFTDAELKTIWDNAPEGDARAVVRLLISTACRRAEVGGMAWSELTGDRWVIPLPRLKNAKTRIRVGAGGHALKIMPMMKEIIDGVHPRVGRDQLFGLYGKNGFSMWSEAKEQLDKVVGGEWHFHDIRRTITSRLGDLGIDPFTTDVLIGHVVGSTYSRSTYQKTLDNVLEIWHQHLAEVIGWKPKVEEGVAGLAE